MVYTLEFAEMLFIMLRKLPPITGLLGVLSLKGIGFCLKFFLY